VGASDQVVSDAGDSGAGNQLRAKIVAAQTTGGGKITFSTGLATGYPMAQRAAWWVVVTATALTLLTIVLAAARSRTYGRPFAGVLMALGLVAMGGSEWVREDLRKPWVIGQYMFVNALRLPAPPGAPSPPPEFTARFGADRFTVDAVNAAGVLKTSAWVRPLPDDLLAPKDYAARVDHEGRELFRALCSSCHTVDGYLGIRALVRGKSAEALNGVIARLASPTDAAGAAAAWNAPAVRVKTWRSRRMPPFAGTDEERQMLAGYLALLGGAAPEMLRPPDLSADVGKSYYDANCAACHGPDGVAPFDPKHRTPAEFYEMIGRLPAINDMMPAFEGTDEQRRALADHLASLPGKAPEGGAR
jgi:mono/diheme cytochrome c family protein